MITVFQFSLQAFIDLISKTMENMRTLVFVDISTTGLQDPDITEICMIACSRTDLLQYPNSIPRALQKIDLKFRPRKTFDIRAEEKSRKYFFIILANALF